MAHLFTVLKEIAAQAGNPPPLCLFFSDDSTEPTDWTALQQNMLKSIPDLHHVKNFELTSKRFMSERSATTVFETLENFPNLESCRIYSWDNFQWGEGNEYLSEKAFDTATHILRPHFDLDRFEKRHLDTKICQSERAEAISTPRGMS